MRKRLPRWLTLVTLGGVPACASQAKVDPSDHFDGKVFFNPWSGPVQKNFFDFLKWQITAKPGDWPNEPVANHAKPLLVEAGQAASIHVTYIGHATTYIQNGRINILTDPQFSDRASPVGFAGPKRVRRPGVALDQLPSVEIVIISHNHYDHLDLPTLRALEARFQPQFIVPLGNGSLLRSQGLKRVTELDWWQNIDNIQLVPAQHWSARGIWDRNQALWGAYVVNLDGYKIFFGGDTGYGPHFRMIRERCGSMDLSLLPIGAYEPRWFMSDNHMNPAEAVKAHFDLESKRSLGIHFETFQLTDESFTAPRRELAEALRQAELANEVFIAPETGETLVIKD